MKTIRTIDMTLISLFIALLIICSQLSLPIGPVPITLQTLAVFLIGLILKPKHSALVVGLYTIMGLIGLPIFANWGGGFQSALSPAFGFIIGFFVSAPIIGWCQRLKFKTNLIRSVLAIVIGNCLLYSIGLLYLWLMMHFILGKTLSIQALLGVGLLPFIPGDLLKIVIAILIQQRLIKLPYLKRYIGIS